MGKLKLCHLRDDGIIYFKYRTTMSLGQLNDAYRELYELIGRVGAQNGKVKVLTDVQDFGWDFGRDVTIKIALSLQNPNAKIIYRSATVVNSPEQRIIAQNIFAVAKRYDIKIFDSVDKALKWLNEEEIINGNQSSDKKFSRVVESQDILMQDIIAIEERQKQIIENERLIFLSQIIGGVAHNLKTPLMTSSAGIRVINECISKINQLYKENSFDPKVMDLLMRQMEYWKVLINNNNIYMTNVINAVKGQAITVEVKEKEINSFNINDLIERILLLMDYELKVHEIILKTNIECKNYIINGDIDSLVQVCNTILTNGMEASNDKIIDLTVTANKNELIIAITNKGNPIPEDIRKKLFVNMCTSKGNKGTGIGLYIAQTIIRGRFNGVISYDSYDNHTSFYIKIPKGVASI